MKQNDNALRFHSDGKAALDYGEITRQTRAIWLTIISRFSNDFQHSGNSTFTFEIHTRNTAYEKLLHEQTTEVSFDSTLPVSSLKMYNFKHINAGFSMDCD